MTIVRLGSVPAMATAIDYEGRLSQAYVRGRALSPGAERIWRATFARHLRTLDAAPADGPGRVLDVGAGAGRFTPMLAQAAGGAFVIAVEPAAGMRVQARAPAGRSVSQVAGAAEALPVEDGSCRAALLSMVIHHLGDRAGAVAELRRALEPGGLVLLRNAFAGRLDRTRYYEFFPTAKEVDEARMPCVEEVVADFGDQGFIPVALETVEQVIDVDLAAHCERLSRRAISTFELISEEDFRRGMDAAREAARREPPAPVVDPVDLLVLRAP